MTNNMPSGVNDPARTQKRFLAAFKATVCGRDYSRETLGQLHRLAHELWDCAEELPASVCKNLVARLEPDEARGLTYARAARLAWFWGRCRHA